MRFRESDPLVMVAGVLTISLLMCISGVGYLIIHFGIY